MWWRLIKPNTVGALQEKCVVGTCFFLLFPEFKRNVTASTKHESVEERQIFIKERNREMPLHEYWDAWQKCRCGHGPIHTLYHTLMHTKQTHAHTFWTQKLNTAWSWKVTKGFDLSVFCLNHTAVMKHCYLSRPHLSPRLQCFDRKLIHSNGRDK